MYRCPACKSQEHLYVTVQVTARLWQQGEDHFETDVSSSDHEWGANSVMWCDAPNCPEQGTTRIAEEFAEKEGQ